ncbi:Blue copper protein [Linum grandiflorum]
MTNLSSLFAVFVAIVACIPSPALAKDFLVGDNHGWTINFDYQAWAYGKDFRVGDRLIFKYPMGNHNVYKANGTEFQNCEVPSAASRGLAMTSGNDVVTLLTPGRKWYICGKPNHCSAYNQKLVIVVKPNAGAWAPAPSPSLASGKDFIVGDNYGWTINFDYQSWAKDKEFHVGDRLTASRGLAMTSGNDVVTLTTPGKKWYICGKPNHCSAYNQKLVIIVKPNSGAWAPTSPALAKDFIVGDNYGWTINFDYQSWAHGKDFRVGDRLIFKYPMGVHNVYKANGTEFQNCEVPFAASRGLAMTSGNDVVTLATPGRKWYICGKPNHCSDNNQKLVIVVKPNAGAWAPSQSPSLPSRNAWAPITSPPSGKDFIVGDNYGWTTNFDYQSWAKGKDFRVGDRLIFKYPMGDHNVYKANGTEFQNCEVPMAASRGLAMTSGNDIVTLATPGRKWYICGKPYHCSSKNQKLVIFVKPKAGSWAPSPSYYSTATVEKKTVQFLNLN